MGTSSQAPEQGHPTSTATETGLLVTRICAGVTLASVILVLYEFNVLGIYFLPIALGALVPLLNLHDSIVAIENWDAFLRRRRDLALTKNGKFAKFFSRPLWSGSLGVFRMANKVPQKGLRAGIRVTLLTYYFGIFLSVACFVAYISIAIVIGIAVLLLMLWVLGMVLGGSSTGGPDRPSSAEGGVLNPIRTSRKSEGFMGMDPHVDHYDDHGRKVGESRQREGFLGLDPHVEHLDADGHVVGESRDREGFLGLDPHVEHNDETGQVIGESREREGFLGLDPHLEHTDESGHVVGESRNREGFLCLDPHVEHSSE